MIKKNEDNAKEMFSMCAYEETTDRINRNAVDGNFIVYEHDDGGEIWFLEKTKTFYATDGNNQPLDVDMDVAIAIFTQLKELGWIKLSK